MAHNLKCHFAGLFILILTAGDLCAANKFDVREFGAAGDGQTLDTVAIQKAIDACAKAGGGEVHLPPGRFLSGTIRLRSGVTFHLEAGSRLVGTTNLSEYSQPHPPESLTEAKWGKWHRALIVGENADDVMICGSGIIDGNKVFDPTGEEKMRGPHAINLLNCHRFVLRDVTILDAANYGVYAQISDDLEFRNVKIVGGWDGIHWRGGPDQWCHNVKIINCQLSTGDDAIAGRYWANTVIQDCLLNSSCNGIRLIGPATGLSIVNNFFRGPGEQPHRSSGHRTNMLCAIMLQPGAWDQTRGLLDAVFVANNAVENVASAFTLASKPGNTVGSVLVDGLRATGVYGPAIAVESWADSPLANVILRDVHVAYAGGGKAWPDDRKVRPMGVDVGPLPAWGLYARNVKNLTLQDVRFDVVSNDFRPVVRADEVERLDLDNVRFPRIAEVADPIVTNQVGVVLREP